MPDSSPMTWLISPTTEAVDAQDLNPPWVTGYSTGPSKTPAACGTYMELGSVGLTSGFDRVTGLMRSSGQLTRLIMWSKVSRSCRRSA